MILKRLPKITRILGGASPLTSDEIQFDECLAISFLFENNEESSIKVKLKANTEDGDAIYIPFLLKQADSVKYENVSADGIEVSEDSAYIATITADSLARNGYDRVQIELISENDIGTIYVLHTQPRYTSNE